MRHVHLEFSFRFPDVDHLCVHSLLAHRIVMWVSGTADLQMINGWMHGVYSIVAVFVSRIWK